MPPLALWMPYAIAIGTLLAAVAWAVEHALRCAGRPTRHLWLAALWLAPVCAVALPFAPAARTADAARAAPATRAVPDAEATAPVSAAATARRREAVPHALAARAERPLALLWLGSSGAFLFTTIAAVGRVAHRTRRAPLAHIAGQPVRVDDALGPAAVALPRRTVVLPTWAFDLEPALLALVLRHEQEHLRARDPWALLAALLAVIAVPWSPAAWWMLRRHRLAIEIDCDRRTLRDACQATARYASLLLLAAGRPRRPRPAVALVVPAMASHLARRITMLTAPVPPSPRRAMALATGMVLVATTVGFALPRPRVPAAPADDVAGIYLFTSTTIPRARMLAPDREFTYLRLAADGRSRYENVTVEIAGETIAPRVFTTSWSTRPWRVEPATGSAPATLCWETPIREYTCSPIERDPATGDITLLGRGRTDAILRRVTR